MQNGENWLVNIFYKIVFLASLLQMKKVASRLLLQWHSSISPSAAEGFSQNPAQ
jgi:hypothetical protein